MVIIEGIDNSGKSTLVTFLAERIPVQVQRGEGPERKGENINDRIRRYLNYKGSFIFDRHPVISQPIYSCINANATEVSDKNTQTFYNRRPLLIYCDPGQRKLDQHQIREGIDLPEFLAGLDLNYEVMLMKYREWAIQHANIIYRIGDDITLIEDAVRTYFSKGISA